MRSRKNLVRSIRRKKKHTATNRKKYVIWAVFSVLSLFVLIALFAWASGYEQMRITSITVQGNDSVSGNDIETIVRENISGKYFFLFHKDNMLVYPRHVISERISLLSEHIRNVFVHMESKSFTTLVVEIVERKPSYLWCDNNDGYNNREEKLNEQNEYTVEDVCYFTDREGYIYSRAPSFSGNVFFKLFGGDVAQKDNPIGGRFLESVEFTKVIALRDALSHIGIETIWLSVRDNDDYEMRVKNSGSIIFSGTQDFNEVIGTMASIQDEVKFTEDLEYVDLRFGKKVYYKQKD